LAPKACERLKMEIQQVRFHVLRGISIRDLFHPPIPSNLGKPFCFSSCNSKTIIQPKLPNTFFRFFSIL
jgi:hypothetical protein